ncbi:MAG: transglutaminase family protein [Pseudomonadota bacterium]
MTDTLLSETALLDFRAPEIQALIQNRGWRDVPVYDRIGAAYDFVQNDILFGYNAKDALPASRVLQDGYGQCNTKTTLLMALLRALDVRCRLHGFTVHKRIQRGVVPEVIYRIAPSRVLHSWVEVHYEDHWVTLEGFILDRAAVTALQDAFPERTSLCAYGAGTDCLRSPKIDWQGSDTFIQSSGIESDLGVFDAPDDFFAAYSQLTGFQGVLYRYAIRHWMNRRVAMIRGGRVPHIPGGERALDPHVRRSENTADSAVATRRESYGP